MHTPAAGRGRRYCNRCFAAVVVTLPEETNDQGVIVLKLQVADEDKGSVIGKQGRIAEAIRTLIRVKAAKAGTKVSLEII